ncbi:Ras suppressor protein 1 [Trichinella spiralis]|uniref:Ras suppressor protein 1 n=1 Tax=Trichinella spiralis TaxID=6334 RepID=A0A0V1BHL8_TRISP|nr:Ras suppressor protein 1 [Trichinella spiralis]
MVRKETDGKENESEVDLVGKGICNFGEVGHLSSYPNITRLTLSHNKITVVPPSIAELAALEMLWLWNNRIEELPTSISSLSKLRVLNLGCNRLRTLPRGFGSFQSLEILDLTCNNLNEKSLPGNFFMLEALRALYLGDNHFEVMSPEVCNLKKLQIVQCSGKFDLVLRDNNLIFLPKEIGELSRLKELHIQGNRLTVLPPEIGQLDVVGSKQVLRLDNNPWVAPIADQLQKGEAQIMNYIRSETYKYLYGRHLAAGTPLPSRVADKPKK